MATSQTTPDPRRRPRGDRSPDLATHGRDGDPTPADQPTGQPNARGTLPLATPPPRTRTTARVNRPDPPTPPHHDHQHDSDPSEVKAIMRARLAAMAAPRDTDDPELAALRAILRDQALMAHVTANVDQWPPLTDAQRATVAALLGRRRHPPPG